MTEQQLIKTISQHPETIEPMSAYIILKMFQKPDKTDGGILLTDQTRERSTRWIGKVVKVGPGHRNIMSGEFVPMQVKEGDTVIITKHSSHCVMFDDEVCHVVFEGDVMGIINMEEAERLFAEDAEKAVLDSEVVLTPAVEETPEPKVVERESGLLVVSSQG